MWERGVRGIVVVEVEEGGGRERDARLGSEEMEENFESGRFFSVSFIEEVENIEFRLKDGKVCGGRIVMVDCGRVLRRVDGEVFRFVVGGVDVWSRLCLLGGVFLKGSGVWERGEEERRRRKKRRRFCL